MNIFGFAWRKKEETKFEGGVILVNVEDILDNREIARRLGNYTNAHWYESVEEAKARITIPGKYFVFKPDGHICSKLLIERDC